MSDTFPSIDLSTISADYASRKFRLGLVGKPGTGKTWSMMSFPKPHTILDYDNKLSQHYGKSGYNIIPMWNNKWLKEKYPVKLCKDKIKASVRDITIDWLETHGEHLDPNSTLGFDSWTFFQQALDEQLDNEPPKNKWGKEDGYAWWLEKGKDSMKVLTLLKNLPCHVVVTFHELPERDDEGVETGIIKPMMQGNVKDRIGGAFSDFYRQVRRPKDSGNKNPLFQKEDTYWWQVTANSAYDPITSRPFKHTVSLKDDTQYIRADFSSLIAPE